MDQLWSPWRSAYIQRADEARAEGCFLCGCAADAHMSADNLVVARYEHTFIVMNRYPYNAGHLLVAPMHHHGDLASLPRAVATELMAATQLGLKAITTVMRPHGCNVGANLGEAAGAGVPDHLHMHIVPRWRGDTNFMPVLAEIKVVSNRLDELWQQLHDELSTMRIGA